MLEGLRQKISDWIYTDPYKRGFCACSALLLSAFAVALLIVLSFPGFNITSESARSFVSASNQIQATILAIVISLTLLAVEMTASKYSPRVIEIFKRNVTLWFFLCNYIVSIIIGSIILTLIDSLNSPRSTTFGTLFVLVLGIYLSLMLILYVFSTLDFLNAEKVVKNLADLIDIETISPQVDPFQSVFDVIYGAVRINDFTTMSTGLACAEERFKELIANRPANWQDDYILFRFFDDIKRCGFLLIEKREDKYVFEIITRLKTINEWAFKEQQILVLNRSCSAIEDVAVKACEYNLVSVVNHSLTTLKETAKSIGGIEGLTQDDEVTKKWRFILFSFVESISNIGKASVKHDLDTSSQKAIEILDNLGRYAIEKNLIFKDDFVFKRIGEIALEYANRDKTTLFNSAVQMLQYLGKYSIHQNHSKEALWILDELRKIGNSVAHQKKTRFVRRVVDAIQFIAISATEKKRSDIEANAIDLIVKFKLIYSALFKREKEVPLLDYGPDTIRVSKEEYDMVFQHESYLVDEYLRPPDDWDGAYDDDDTMDLSL